MNLQFRTSPIKISLGDSLELCAHLGRLRVHPTNFICDDGIPLVGNPIQVKYDEEASTAVICAEGGLDIAHRHSIKGYYASTTPVLGNLLDDVLDEKFCKKHRGLIVYLENCDETGVLDDDISRVIHMDQYHSKEGKLARADARTKAIDAQIAEVDRQMGLLAQFKAKKLEELKSLQWEQLTCDLPF
ncbi:TPA: hypothetical protein OV554_003715 [Acinetobacter baumannii]|nr:hypothetical protein [Acinetobacter baumannii]